MTAAAMRNARFDLGVRDLLAVVNKDSPLPAHPARLLENAATDRWRGLCAPRSAGRESSGQYSWRGTAKRKTVIQTNAIMPISAFAIPGLLAIECAMHDPIQASGTAPKVTVRIDAGLKKKCPRTTLACVTARVQPGPSPVALLAEMNQRELESQELPFPRAVLESPHVH